MKKSWFQLCILARKQQKVRENPFFTRLWNYRISIWVWVVIWLPRTWDFFHLFSLSSRIETALSPAKCHLLSRNSWMARVCLFCHLSGFICEWSFKARHSQGWRHSVSIPRHIDVNPHYSNIRSINSFPIACVIGERKTLLKSNFKLIWMSRNTSIRYQSL